MTATVTENVSKEPGRALKRSIAALDTGNRTTQWIDPKGNVRTIPLKTSIAAKKCLENLCK